MVRGRGALSGPSPLAIVEQRCQHMPVRAGPPTGQRPLFTLLAQICEARWSPLDDGPDGGLPEHLGVGFDLKLRGLHDKSGIEDN